MRTQIHHLVAEAAGVRGDAPAVTFKDVTVTYAQLWREVGCFAAALSDLGLRRGDRVAVYLDKRIETVTRAVRGVGRTRSFRAGQPAAEAQAGRLHHAGLRRPGPGDVARPARPAARGTRGVQVRRARGARGRRACRAAAEAGREIHGEPLAADPRNVPATAVDAIDADMAAILYTSGSTGRPKGVVLSHRNLIVGAESVSHYLGNSPDDVILSALPLSFDAGFSQLTTAFSVGAHVVLLNYLLPADVVRLCAQHRVTGLTCVPPLWIQIADQDWPTEAARHLRYFANTGGRMPKATLDRLRSVFPQATPFLMYGLTEAFRSTYLDPAEVDRRPDSIGKAIPNAEILVVRPDGSLCDPGEEGELVHRGALVAMGYWNDPERTAERFRPAPAREPGLCTEEMAVWSGDVVVRDEEGFLYFVGRKDEMIKTSGYRVSPSEIEEVAYDTGLVRDAVALGVEDAKLGQHVVLVVSPASGAQVDVDALLSQMKKALPLYMLPKRVDVRPEIPRSPNGKFDRTLLREELTA